MFNSPLRGDGGTGTRRAESRDRESGLVRIQFLHPREPLGRFHVDNAVSGSSSPAFATHLPEATFPCPLNGVVKIDCPDL